MNDCPEPKMFLVSLKNLKAYVFNHKKREFSFVVSPGCFCLLFTKRSDDKNRCFTLKTAGRHQRQNFVSPSVEMQITSPPS